MRFRLIESPDKWYPPKHIINNYNELKTQEERIKFIKKYIMSEDPAFNKMSGIEDLIIKSILIHGIDPKHNDFLELISELPFIIHKDDIDHKSKFTYILEAYLKNKLDLNQDYLKKISLYDRSYKDFIYTINAFNLILTGGAEYYLKNTDAVNIESFMDNGIIKPAQEIYDIIELWSQDNEYTKAELKNRKVKNGNPPKLTQKELEVIKDKYLYGVRDNIEDKLRQNGELKPGVIIFARTIHEYDTSNINITQNQMGEYGFWIWNGDEWEKYETPEALKVKEPR